MSIESAFISGLLRDGAMTEALDAGVTVEFFAQERWRRSWEWITEYYGRSGKCPPASAFARNFPSYELDEDEEPFSILVAELQTARRDRIVREGLQAAVEQYDAKNGGPEESLHAVQTMIAEINRTVAVTDVEHSIDFVGQAVQQAVNMKPMELLGLPTSFPTIDESTGGLQPEQLVYLAGLPKRGKSSVAIRIAMSVWEYRCRALVIGFEMSNPETKNRILSQGAHIDLNHILRGQLTGQDIDALYEFEAEAALWDEEGGSLILVHDLARTMTVGGIAAKIEQHAPDFVLVDGVYMMEDERGEKQGSPQALTNISRSLKRMAQTYKLPILGTVQAIESRTTKSRGVQLDSMMYTGAFAQDADAVFGMDRDDLSKPEAKLKVVAARASLGVEVDIVLDYLSGTVEESSGASLQNYATTMDVPA